MLKSIVTREIPLSSGARAVRASMHASLFSKVDSRSSLIVGWDETLGADKNHQYAAEELVKAVEATGVLFVAESLRADHSNAETGFWFVLIEPGSHSADGLYAVSMVNATASMIENVARTHVFMLDKLFGNN